jgi:hypothetical protein
LAGHTTGVIEFGIAGIALPEWALALRLDFLNLFSRKAGEPRHKQRSPHRYSRFDLVGMSRFLCARFPAAPPAFWALRPDHRALHPSNFA